MANTTTKTTTKKVPQTKSFQSTKEQAPVTPAIESAEVMHYVDSR